MKSSLPDQWEQVSMDEIATIIQGQSPPGHSYNEQCNGLPFFQGKAEFGELYPTIKKWCTLTKKEAYPGDILLSIRAPVGPTNLANVHCAIGRGLAAVRPMGDIPSKYLLYYLRYSSQKLAEQATGSTFKAISGKQLREYPIMVAPLPEQHRIVDKIEQLFAELDKGVAKLKKAREKLELYRQSLLKAAFEGRLTEKWRLSACLPVRQTGEELLARIKTEREKRYQQQVEEWKINNRFYPSKLPKKKKGVYFVYVIECEDGSLYKGWTSDIQRRWKEHNSGSGAEWTRKHKPIRILYLEECSSEEEALQREKYLKSGIGREWLKQRQETLPAGRQAAKPRKPKELPPLTKEELAELPKLPYGWILAKFGNVYDIVDGDRGINYPKRQDFSDHGYCLFLNTKNVRPDGFNFSTTQFISKEKHEALRKGYLKRGDVIFTSRGTIGNVAYYSDDVQFDVVRINSGMFILRGASNIVDPEYLLYCLQSQVVQNQITRFRSGTAQPQLPIREFQEFGLPIPSIEEQREIIKIVKLQLAAQKELTQTISTALAQADLLRQSILKKAFFGRLVPQDPNDLPAPRPGKWFVYALECDDGSIYVGQTENIEERWKQHASGKGAEWTKRHPPVRLVHWEEFDSIQAAVNREKELKTGFGRKWLKREYTAGRTRQAGEPASVLLKRIQAEREKAAKETKRTRLSACLSERERSQSGGHAQAGRRRK
jgi:predicted GIY-YIG superfamily endonuclease